MSLLPSPFSFKLFEVLGIGSFCSTTGQSEDLHFFLWTTLVAKISWNLDALSNGFTFAVRPLIRGSQWQILCECIQQVVTDRHIIQAIPHSLKLSFSQLLIFKSTSTHQWPWPKLFIPWAPTWTIQRWNFHLNRDYSLWLKQKHLQRWRAWSVCGTWCAALVLGPFARWFAGKCMWMYIYIYRLYMIYYIFYILLYIYILYIILYVLNIHIQHLTFK